MREKLEDVFVMGVIAPLVGVATMVWRRWPWSAAKRGWWGYDAAG